MKILLFHQKESFYFAWKRIPLSWFESWTLFKIRLDISHMLHCIYRVDISWKHGETRLVSPFARDFYTQLHAMDRNHVTFHVYPHFPLTIGLPACIRCFLRLTITRRCSRFEMEREAFERNRLRSGRHARVFQFSAVRITLDAPSSR